LSILTVAECEGVDGTIPVADDARNALDVAQPEGKRSMISSEEPITSHFRLDAASCFREYRGDDRFSITRVQSTCPLPEPIHKSSSVAAMLVSVSVRPLAASGYRLWVDGRVISTAAIPAFRTNVVDFAATPTCWAGAGFDYVHFQVRRAAIDDVAASLGYEPVGGFRLSVLEDDVLLAQMTKSVLPILGDSGRTSHLALDHLELILGAHLVQRYGAARRRRTDVTGGLATWQKTRATELLRENLDGCVRLVDLARECNLSASYFARSFKTSFGVTSRAWLTGLRIERAKELLETTLPLADVASESGFGDQAAFTRTFRRLVGVAPGRWRREHRTR
jgi:AraC-like DNA-binding protein